MSPFDTATSALDTLSSRFSDLQQPLRQECPGEGATVTAIDERNAARAITTSRLADWAYSAKAEAKAQAEADGALMRAPSPAALEALGLQVELSNGSPATLAAYQSAGSERLAAKKSHTAATSQTTWPDSVTPADMPAPPTAPTTSGKKSAGGGKDKTQPIGDGFMDDTEGEGDDRPVGDGFGGEGVDDSATDADDSTATPATNSSADPTASTPLPLDSPAPTMSAEAAGTSLSADTSDPSGARTGTLSNATSPAGSPTAQQPPPQMAPMQPNAQVTGPRGGASPQLGQPQNSTRQAPTGPRPAQTGKDDTQPPARDTTFDPLIAGTGGAALGIAGGAHTASGASTGPASPSVSTTPSGATGVPTGPAHGSPTPPPPAPPAGMGAGSALRPPAPPSGSGDTVSHTARPTVIAADVDPSLDPLTANPDDLDWTPPTINEEPKK